MSDSKIKLSVVIPVYNEEAAVLAVIENIAAHKRTILETFPCLGDIQVLLINDGSRDRSLTIMKEAIRNKSQFSIIHHRTNRGYGNALQTGFKRAAGTLILFYDGDGTFDFLNAKLLLKEFFESGADMVVGCRFTRQSKMPVLRKIGNRLFGGLIYLMTREKVKDPCSGIRVLKKSILPGVLPLPNGLNFIIVMTVKLLFTHVNWRECPVPYHERVGSSKLSVVRDGLEFAKSLFSVVLLNNPFQMYFLGTVFAVVLFAYMGYVPCLHALAGKISQDDLIWMIGAAFFLNVGFLCYSVGVILTFINRLIFGKRAPTTMFGAYLVSELIVRHFRDIALLFLGIAGLIYAGDKMGFIPHNCLTLLAVTTFGLNGLLLGLSHSMITHIKQHLHNRQTQERFMPVFTKDG